MNFTIFDLNERFICYRVKKNVQLVKDKILNKLRKNVQLQQMCVKRQEGRMKLNSLLIILLGEALAFDPFTHGPYRAKHK